MDRTTIAGRETSRIGFGCGRLAGGGAARASIQLIERARELGITHFDVAPSYGLGFAEDVLGEALAGDPDATVTTKAGIGRPANAGLKTLGRQLLRPLLSATPAIRRRLGARATGAPRGQFGPAQVEASVAESLRRLRRDRVDALLLHEPAAEAITPALLKTLHALEAAGKAGAIGSGTGGDPRDLVPVGTVRQHGWYPDLTDELSGSVIVHGLMRRFPRRENRSAEWHDELRSLGFDPADPAAWPGFMLTLALATVPRGIVLVSSTNPERLAGALGGINWSLARGAWPDFVERGRALLRDSRAG